MALYTLSGLLLALEGALSLVPGRSGREWRALSDGVYGFLRELQAQPPQEFVSVRCLDRDGRVQVQIRTWGLSFPQAGDFRLERGVPKPRKVFPLLWELLACWVALGAVGMVWGWPMGQVLLGGAVLCLGNLLLRPVGQVILLPLNLALGGLLTLLWDALLVLGACGCSGLSLGFPICLLVAVLLGLFRRPLAQWKWGRGSPREG